MVKMQVLYGLKMNEEEFNNFAKVYCRMRAISPVYSAIRYLHCDDCEDAQALFGAANPSFRFVELDPNPIDAGMYFKSFKNGIVEEVHKDFDRRVEKWYVLPCGKPLDSYDSLFEKPAYGSYDELVQEFKDELGKYLPSTFEFETHIGKIMYAKRTKRVKLVVSDIAWDTDDDWGSDDIPELPNKVELVSCRELGDIEMLDIDGIADFLSDNYGFCVKSFCTELKTDM